MSLASIKESKVILFTWALTFLISGLIINLLQLLFYATIRTFNKRLFWKINWYLCGAIYSQVIYFGHWWCGIKVKLYTDPEDLKKYFGKEHAFIIGNHQYENDWVVGLMASDRFGILGNCKCYMKKSAKYVPGIGWSWWMSEQVFLDRTFEKDKRVISEKIIELANHPDPMWVFFCPEGTRLTETKLQASKEFCRKKNLPELKYHLFPRTKGFTLSIPTMKGKIPALYEMEIAYSKEEAHKTSIKSLFFGKSCTAHLYMRRIPMESIPDNEVDQEKFLIDMFIRKDKMRESFLNTGSFFTMSGVPRMQSFELERSLHPLSTVLWNICIITSLIWYMVKWLAHGDFVYFFIGAGVITAFCVLMKKAVSIAEKNDRPIKKATNGIVKM